LKNEEIKEGDDLEDTQYLLNYDPAQSPNPLATETQSPVKNKQNFENPYRDKSPGVP